MFKKILVASGAALGAAVLIACGGTGGKGSDTPSATSSPAASAVATMTSPASTEPTKQPTAVAPGLTNVQKQALGKAQDYLGFTHFSRAGLIKQLKFDGFAESDSAKAIDSLNVDWNAQAAGKGKDYLDFTHFSRDGLIKQLKFDGFTAEQAAYGAKENGL